MDVILISGLSILILKFKGTMSPKLPFSVNWTIFGHHFYMRLLSPALSFLFDDVKPLVKPQPCSDTFFHCEASDQTQTLGQIHSSDLKPLIKPQPVQVHSSTVKPLIKPQTLGQIHSP